MFSSGPRVHFNQLKNCTESKVQGQGIFSTNPLVQKRVDDGKIEAVYEHF